MKKMVLSGCCMLMSVLSRAQQLNTAASRNFWDDPLFRIYILGLFVFIALILTLVAAMIAVRVLNLLVERGAREKAARMGVSYVKPQSAWTKFWQNANALIPLEEEKNIELDHNYDGIRELDNHLPPWWKGLFYGTIVFAFVYMVLFHLSNALPLSEQEYQNEVSVAEEQARILKASQPASVIDEDKLTFSNDATMIARGKSVFMSSNCGSCHRNDGGGNTIGPNLTDAFWLHGGDIKSVFSTIKNGVVEKAMPAWGKVMSQKDVRDVAFYVMSLQGTNPQNAKAPQGELFKPTPNTASLDSTKLIMIK